MRIKLLLALLGLGLVLALVGCGGNETPVTANLTGTVVGSNNLAIPNSTITLFQNGQQVGQPFVSQNGRFTFTNLNPGTFTLIVNATANNVRKVFGPVALLQDQTVTIPTRTLAELPGGVTNPVGSATLVVEANNGIGVPINQFSVKVGSLATVPSTLNNPSFAVVTGIPAQSQNITVTNTENGGTVTIPNVPFSNDTVTLLNVFVPTGGIANRFTATGVVSNAETNQPIAGLNVAIREIANSTKQTDANGAFTFANLPAGVFSLALSSTPTNASSSIFTTFAGPFNGTSSAVNLPPVFTFTREQAAAAGIPIPTNGKATLVVYAVSRVNNTVEIINNATVIVQGQQFTGSTPLAIPDLVASNLGSDVEVKANNQDVILKKVPLKADDITIVTAFIPATAQ